MDSASHKHLAPIGPREIERTGSGDIPEHWPAPASCPSNLCSRAPAPPVLHEAVTLAAMCLARVKWHFRPQERFLSPGCDGAERPECDCRIGDERQPTRCSLKCCTYLDGTARERGADRRPPPR